MNQALRAGAQRSPTRRRQSGAVLVVALLFLLIITMLGVSSLQSTTADARECDWASTQRYLDPHPARFDEASHQSTLL